MRAVRLRSPGGLDRLEIGSIEGPALGPGELRVRVHASSLNFHDYLVVTGRMPVADGRIPMSDGAGEVVEVGEDVTGFAPGDRVVSTFFPRWLSGSPEPASFAELPGDRNDGFACDEVVVREQAVTHAPVGYSHPEAATLTCAALTAWRALFVEASVTPGDIVLVQGTGGVSIFALQFAKAAGARVLATSSSDTKLDRLRALGADLVLNYRSEPAWGAKARALTGGRGVDHVVEVAGALKQSMAACRIGAHIAIVGAMEGASVELPVFAAVGRNLRINTLSVGSREHQKSMIRAIEANGVRPVIDSFFPLEGISDAFRHQEAGRHFGKICLEW